MLCAPRRNNSFTAAVNHGYSHDNHAHAVTHLGGVQKYWYDDNGNMTRRDVGGATTYLIYDAENRLLGASGAASAEFIYDGDGNKVASVISGTITVYIGNYYEWTSNSAKKYYYTGSSRLALRDGETLYYLFGDHLSSTSKIYRVDNSAVTTLLYKAWGETRYSNGDIPTTYHFTGQRELSILTCKCTTILRQHCTRYFRQRCATL
jgi:hypothetical protein